MNEQKVCIMTWVYGKKYQGWIPMYIYSIKKNYPKYDIKICIDSKLSKHVKNLMDQYDLWSGVDVIEEVFEEVDFLKSDMEKRSFRWLLNGAEFANNYDYVYIGDVDIYIVKEEYSLHEQHIEHLKNTNGIYSNAIRLRFWDYITNPKKRNKHHLMKLTGLHFVDAKKYFLCVRKNQVMIMKYLKGKRSKLIDKVFFSDDERCLWLLTLLSKIKFPKGSYQLAKNSFRPLHGIHFALGREYDTYMKMFKRDSYMLQMHDGYYKAFKDEYNTDLVLRQLIWDSSFYIINTVKDTCKVWKDNMLENEILEYI